MLIQYRLGHTHLTVGGLRNGRLLDSPSFRLYNKGSGDPGSFHDPVLIRLGGVGDAQIQVRVLFTEWFA